MDTGKWGGDLVLLRLRLWQGLKEAAEKLGFVAVLAVAGAKAHPIFKCLRHD
jgi:hypothetical protein